MYETLDTSYEILCHLKFIRMTSSIPLSHTWLHACKLIQGIFRCSGLTKKPIKLTSLVNFKTDQSESAG